MKLISRNARRLASLSAGFAALLALSPSVASEKYQHTKTPEFPEAREDRALVYVVRDEYPRILSYAFSLFADLTPMGYLCRKCYLAAHVEPGVRFLWGPEENNPCLIRLEAGKTYLLRLSEQWAQNRVVSTSWHPLDPADLEELIRSEKLSYTSMTAEGVEALQKDGMKGFTKTRARTKEPPFLRATGLGPSGLEAGPTPSIASAPETASAQVDPPPTPTPPSREIAMEEIIRAVESAEEFERAGSLETAPDLTRFIIAKRQADGIRKTLHTVDLALSAHLEGNPTDLDALFLQARLDRALVILTPEVISGGERQPPDALGPKRDPQVALDRILELSPDDSRALYMKARLHGIPGLSEGGEAELEKAIRFARRAVEKEPANVEYREALALYLVGSDQEREALEVLKDVTTEHHPMRRLLMDRSRLPWPPGAVAQKHIASGLATMGLETTEFEDYPTLRVASYAVPSTPSEVEAFYKGRWNRVRFFTKRGREGSIAHFEWRGDDLVPINRNPEKLEGPSGSLLLLLMLDVSQDPPDVRERMNMPATGPISLLIAYNWRELAGGEAERGRR